MHTKNEEAGKEESQKSDVAQREEAVLDFWRKQNIFEKSVATPAGQEPVGDFVFYDGPPFATGLPHYGHILASTIKDAVPRFWTMNGYRVRRQWGWDCHGLPLENLIEKQLGLATKRDIEEYGIQNFNEQARAAVMEYADDWKRIIPRMGRWADMDDDYKTMDSTYTESVWWVFKTLHEKGLVYEGFKSMHLCPRCGTTLSNFEVNQGYKDIKDIAVTVKLPLLDDAGKPTDDSLLVWTTTPWTLPGNLAAAVHKDALYVKVAVDTDGGKENVVLAKDRLEQLGDVAYEVLEEQTGEVLVGTSYQPPFPYLQDQDMEGKEHAWKIYHADYVDVEGEGTGAVHLAPAYGEEDMELAKAEGMPIFHHVDTSGRFKEFVTEFAGKLAKPKDDDDAEVSHLDTDIEIVKALKENGALFKKENITHSYPHCWRCDTPLLNYATTSWFVEVTKIRDELVAKNQAVHWVPEHVGTSRFGKWLEGARDWAVSRQRYWGAPLPVWRNPETNDYKVFGSLAELQGCIQKSGNTYFTMRHGESEKNVQNIVTGEVDAPYPLTEKGKEEARATAQSLQGNIDLIITSPVVRAKETAELLAEELGMKPEQVQIDERITEMHHGILEGKTLEEYRAVWPRGMHRFKSGPEGGESWTDTRQRMGEFLFDLERTYQNKTILIVSHGDPLALLHATASGVTAEETLATWDDKLFPSTGTVTELSFVPYPHNDDYELDFHRPYIDQIELSEGETKLERVPDVFDCWFESGSMPYAQHHYPFEHEQEFEKELFPANFIAEGLDQTRGWFYSLIVLGVALFGKSPYENVIVNGLVLAEDGKKMSKSLQNYPDPMALADRVGIDAMRFYLLSSPVVHGEDLNFSEKEVQELQRKNIGRLHNVLAMYETYADGTPARDDSKNVLDVWIIARLNQLVTESTAGYKNYELDRATRPIVDFIDDLSVWYLRRSRDRLKGEDEADKQATLATLRHVLQTLALVMAPAMPFYAEYLWGRVKEEGAAESVHLAHWPAERAPDPVALGEMSIVREFVTLALEQRAKAGIKVRQPLPELQTQVELTPGYAELVADEVNVKAVTFDASIASRVQLSTTITPELQAEGDARELIRQLQDLRKTTGLEPQDTIQLNIDTDDAGQALFEQFKDDILRTAGVAFYAFTDVTEAGTKIHAGEHTFTVEIVQ